MKIYLHKYFIVLEHADKYIKNSKKYSFIFLLLDQCILTLFFECWWEYFGAVGKAKDGEAWGAGEVEGGV